MEGPGRRVHIDQIDLDHPSTPRVAGTDPEAARARLALGGVLVAKTQTILAPKHRDSQEVQESPMCQANPERISRAHAGHSASHLATSGGFASIFDHRRFGGEHTLVASLHTLHTFFDKTTRDVTRVHDVYMTRPLFIKESSLPRVPCPSFSTSIVSESRSVSYNIWIKMAYCLDHKGSVPKGHASVFCW